MLAGLAARPAADWRRIALSNVIRRYRTPRIVEDRVRLKDYRGEIQQIAIADLGHDKPTFLVANQLRASAASIVDRYARRMVIANTIADAIDFFHMDALSSAVPMNVNFDLQLTIMASGLYRQLAYRVRQGFETASADKIFRKLVHTTALVDVAEQGITVTLGRRANNPLLLNAGYCKIRQLLPWLENRNLVIRFV